MAADSSSNSAAVLEGPVAVTGATGFIGRALCARLVREGIAVRALVRDGARAPAGTEAIVGSLDASRALDALVDGATAVIHLAGAVRGVDRAAFDAVNVAGTRALLRAVEARAPSSRLVHVSSLAARAPHLSDYAASKRAAEGLLTDALPCPWTILRPSAVYGPGDVELRPLLRAMARGFCPVPAAARHRVCLVHVDDVVDAILTAAAHRALGHGPYELSDQREDGYDWNELAAAVEAVAGRRALKITVPESLLAGAGALNRRLAAWTHRAPMLTPGKARELCHPDWSCDPAFRAAAGWSPRWTLEDGLRDVLGPA